MEGVWWSGAVVLCLGPFSRLWGLLTAKSGPVCWTSCWGKISPFGLDALVETASAAGPQLKVRISEAA